MFEYNALIVRVVDGDTVDVLIDLGFTISTKQRIRLDGINAPENNTLAGQAARGFLATALPPGSKVRIESKKPGSGDKYGRYLATVHLGSMNLNETMVSQGYALAWDGKGSKPI